MLRMRGSIRLSRTELRSATIIRRKYLRRRPPARCSSRCGAASRLDDSAYTLPPSDTLTYTVSSLLSFLDTLPRYRIRVIDKYVTVNDRYSLSFRTGDARLVDTLGNNARELARIAALMERIVTQREFHVDSIVLTASASPEGRRGLNERLSRARAEALRSYLAGCFGRRADRLLTIRSAGELWPELTARIARDDRLAHRDEILGIIRRIGDPDRREEEIRRRYPAEYACIRAEHYPALRAVNLRCHLRRVGMVKDTIHTTELDTAYLRGRQLLENANTHRRSTSFMTTGIAIRPSHCSRWDKTGRRCASSKHFPRQP